MNSNKSLLDEFLYQVDDPKTREIARAIIELDPDVDPVYKQINNLFIAFVNASIISDKSGKPAYKDGVDSDRAYSIMIKLLYTQAIIFNSNMLPVICIMFIYHCGKELKVRSRARCKHWKSIYSGNNSNIGDFFSRLLTFMTDFRRGYSNTLKDKYRKVTYSMGGDQEIIKAVSAVSLLMDNPCKITVIDPEERLNQYYYFTTKNGSPKSQPADDPTCYINYEGILYPKEKAASK